MNHQFATDQLDEFHFLSRITANLASMDARHSYADWLESKGDSRSEFVRDLSMAMMSISASPRFPQAELLPKAWKDILGLSLFEQIVKQQMSGYFLPLCRIARPRVTFESTVVGDDAIPPGSTKLGGRPDLPVDTEWPKNEDGWHLGFIGQIDLSELQLTQLKLDLPKSGLLSFFCFKDDNMQGPDKDRDTQVMYSASPQVLVRREPPKDIGTNYRDYGDEGNNATRPACTVRFTESLELPYLTDKLPERVSKEFEPLREYQTNLCLIREQLDECLRMSSHQLGGYQQCCRCDDPSPGAEWVPFASFGSDDNLLWNWCDGDCLLVYVHEADMRDRTYQRIVGYGG